MWEGEEGRKAYQNSIPEGFENTFNQLFSVKSALDVATDAMLDLDYEDLLMLQERIDLRLEESLK